MYEEPPFVDRRRELDLLKHAFESDMAELIVIYGRRRVGKTELVKRSLKNVKHIYFLADTSPDNDNRERFRKLLAKATGNTLIERAELSWEELLKLASQAGFVIVIDEFPFLIQSNSSIPSIFQRVWDNVLQKMGAKMILLGSSISVMESDVLGYRSPIYGRRTAQIYLTPLKFKDIKGLFPEHSWEDIVRIYGIADGIPAYLQEIRYRLMHGERLTDVFTPGKPLFEEGEFLIRSELWEPGRYLLILKAIAFSNTKFGEIVNFTSLPSPTVSQYLSNLKKLHLVRVEHPFGARETRRNARYFLSDNYFNFYFRFIYTHRDELIEMGEIEGFEEMFNTYLGYIFEKVAMEMIWEKMRMGEIQARSAGRWWRKDAEIDVVAEGRKNIYFFEVKWASLKKKEIGRIISTLQEKVDEHWKTNKRIHLGVVGKEIAGKEELRREGFLLYDLRDL